MEILHIVPIKFFILILIFFFSCDDTKKNGCSNDLYLLCEDFRIPIGKNYLWQYQFSEEMIVGTDTMLYIDGLLNSKIIDIHDIYPGFIDECSDMNNIYYQYSMDILNVIPDTSLGDSTIADSLSIDETLNNKNLFSIYDSLYYSSYIINNNQYYSSTSIRHFLDNTYDLRCTWDIPIDDSDSLNQNVSFNSNYSDMPDVVTKVVGITPTCLNLLSSFRLDYPLYKGKTWSYNSLLGERIYTIVDEEKLILEIDGVLEAIAAYKIEFNLDENNSIYYYVGKQGLIKMEYESLAELTTMHYPDGTGEYILMKYNLQLINTNF